ncbi:hypothetical protein BC826DRAFT_990298 [Russula brevipes]|nr:hypothetical protein BC826DRAFT_990298 [Russula brevipes]
MNVPRFTNPHCSHEQQTVTVSRATLFPQSPHFVANDDKLAELDSILKTNLDLSHTRKRKRRTSSIGQSAPHEAHEHAPFRLLSAIDPPKVISLEPKPLPTRTIWEPPCEDNDRESDLRRQRACSAAVEIPSLIRSAQAYISRPQKPDKVIRASVDVPLSSLAFFLAEIPHNNPRPLRASHERAALPSPHDVTLKGDLPVISLQLPRSEQPMARPKRMRRRRTTERPPPTFWRPLRCWGGKSSGYAMGYEGSRPVEDEYEQRQKYYARDKIRKVVYISGASQ